MDVFAVINTAVNILLLWGLLLAYRSLRADHAQRRLQGAMDVLRSWREYMDRSDVRAAFTALADLTEEDQRSLAEKREAGNIDRTTITEIRPILIGALNLFEEIAVAYKYNVGERAVIEEALIRSVCRHSGKLAAFRQKMKDSDRGDWPVLREGLDDLWVRHYEAPRRLP